MLSNVESAAQNVLVVDDNKDGAQTLAMLLRFHGHHVEVAYNGSEALEVAEVQKPNVVLLDIAMPGMDGYKLAQCLRANPHTRKSLLIAISGYCLPGDRARSQAAGINLHILKPVKKEQILEVLRAVPNISGGAS